MQLPVRIELPTPFPVGGVNAYLLPGPPVTLIDAGPRTVEARRALVDALARESLRLEDVELLLLTHHHVDHAGLAETVRAESGCRVAAVPRVAALLRDLDGARVAESRWAARLLEAHGAPESVVAAVGPIMHGSEGLAASIEAVDELEVDGTVDGLAVRLRPGHSGGDTLFVDEAAGWAIAGDHVLAIGPSTTMVEPGTSPQEPPTALRAYRRSLAATREDGLALAFVGHGKPVDDVRSLVDRRLAEQRRLADRLGREIAAGASTAWELVDLLREGRAFSGRHPVSPGYVALSHVLGHLELLVEDGSVDFEDVGGRVRLVRR